MLAPEHGNFASLYDDDAGEVDSSSRGFALEPPGYTGVLQILGVLTRLSSLLVESLRR